LYGTWSSPAFPPTLGFFVLNIHHSGIDVMAKPIRKRQDRRRSIQGGQLPLGQDNFRIIFLGILVIVGGYVAMLEGSVEGFLPLVLAPILLLIGYCVIVPFGILYRRGMFTRHPKPRAEEQKASQ
jgi:hypothetical protein